MSLDRKCCLFFFLLLFLFFFLRLQLELRDLRLLRLQFKLPETQSASSFSSHRTELEVARKNFTLGVVEKEGAHFVE